MKNYKINWDMVIFYIVCLVILITCFKAISYMNNKAINHLVTEKGYTYEEASKIVMSQD